MSIGKQMVPVPWFVRRLLVPVSFTLLSKGPVCLELTSQFLFAPKYRPFWRCCPFPEVRVVVFRCNEWLTGVESDFLRNSVDLLCRADLQSVLLYIVVSLSSSLCCRYELGYIWPYRRECPIALQIKSGAFDRL